MIGSVALGSHQQEAGAGCGYGRFQLTRPALNNPTRAVLTPLQLLNLMHRAI